ncbi:hypothetical protein NC652_041797 [Populus alba x Populus x berolinensis]|nr:hypothetical protein NC652_041797 [Populus alba x Populus x berolinensis]
MIYLEKEQKARQGKAWPLSLTLFFDSSKRERRGEERETYALNITDCVWLLLNLFKGNNDNSKEASPVLTSIGWVKLYTKTNAAASAELERIREIHHPYVFEVPCVQFKQSVLSRIKLGTLACCFLLKPMVKEDREVNREFLMDLMRVLLVFVHLTNMEFLTLRPVLGVEFFSEDTPLRMRVEILGESRGEQIWKKSMKNVMAWLRPEVMTSELDMDNAKSTEMEVNMAAEIGMILPTLETCPIGSFVLKMTCLTCLPTFETISASCCSLDGTARERRKFDVTFGDCLATCNCVGYSR